MQDRRELLARAAAFTALASSAAAPSSLRETPLEFEDDLFLAALGRAGRIQQSASETWAERSHRPGRKIKRILSAGTPERRILWAAGSRSDPRTIATWRRPPAKVPSRLHTT